MERGGYVMMDLIIFLCFVIFMLLAICWIQAMEITQLKAKNNYLEKLHKNYYNNYLLDNDLIANENEVL